jgi:hypothetical protein
MNSTSQLDLHPDAESLNAFVEQVLPERERAQVLAHLASCGHCRQVVYLAQEAAGDSESPTAPAAQPVAVRPAATRIAPWFRGWWSVWIPTAALAMILGVAVVIQVRHAGTTSEPRNEMAKAAPAPVLQTDAVQSAGKPTESSTTPTLVQKKLERKAVTASSPAAPQAPRPQSAPSVTVITGADAEAPISANGIGGLSQTGSALHGNMSQPRTVYGPAMQNQQNWNNSQQTVASPPAPSAPPADSFVSEDANLPQMNANMVSDAAKASPASPLTARERSSGPLAAGKSAIGDSKMQGIAAGRFAPTAIPLNLPGGLRTLSSASSPHRTVAIDMAGGVFLSEDAGITWKAVAPQWSGRVVLVRFRENQKPIDARQTAQPGPSVGGPVSAVSGLSGRAVAGSLTPPGQFEIVNDTGQMWLSADGKTWKAK